MAEGRSGRLLSLTVALFAVAGGGYTVSTAVVLVISSGSGSFGTPGGGAGAAAAATLSTVTSFGPLVAVGTGAWIGHDLRERVTSTALVAVGAGVVAMAVVVFLFSMVAVTVLSSGSGGSSFGSSPGLGDQIAPLLGVIAVTALTGAIAAEVVDDL